MVAASASERSEPSSPKRLKLEEPSSDATVSEEDLTNDLRLFDEEWKKSGGFDVDFSKLRHTFGAGAVDLDDDDLVDEHDTNRDLLNMLSEMAISYYKEETDTSLELVKVLRANFHPSAAITLFITFEANDLSDGNQTKLYQAVVRYLPVDIEVCSCWPKPL
ncbi:unnamed protein product [Thlaspi arvense]|uniref:Uncharacterized protein n=1 Tax=Thlaspi arvense TaxID=13288 RepID=A0AAU9T3E9_THLAR|nr:unnamed protein product [Thlaspi arvense]